MLTPATEPVFQSAFEHAAIGMALVSPEGRWLSVNRSICEIVGYSEAELLARTFQEITHPADLDLDLAYLGQLLAGEISSYRLDKRYFHKSGRTIWIHLTVSLVRDEQGAPSFFISQIEDITARKEAEELREKMFQLPHTLHFVAGFDGYFKRLSQGWTNLLGYTREELLGRPFLEFVHPEDREATQAEAARVFGGITGPHFENRYCCADGSYRWLLWASISIPEQQIVYGVAIDFTARKALEINLRVAVSDRERLISELEAAARQNRALRDQLVTVCAWTNRIFHDGRWMSPDEFLAGYLGLHLTHGISEEGKALFLSKQREAVPPDEPEAASADAS